MTATRRLVIYTKDTDTLGGRYRLFLASFPDSPCPGCDAKPQTHTIRRVKGGGSLSERWWEHRDGCPVLDTLTDEDTAWTPPT